MGKCIGIIATVLLIISPTDQANAQNELKKLGQQLEQAFAATSVATTESNRCSLGASAGGENSAVVIALAPDQRALQFGDRILAIDGQEEGSVPLRLSSIPPDRLVSVRLLRDGQEINVEVQCRNVAPAFAARAEMVKAMQRNRPQECVTAIDSHARQVGMNAYFTNLYQQCLFYANQKNQYWVTNQYPQQLYFLWIQRIREDAAIAAHSENGYEEFEGRWPNIVVAMEDLRQRNASTYASELKREFDKQLAILSGSGKARPQTNASKAVSSSGTCFVVSPDGLVITNQHVLTSASEVFVTLNDGRRLRASPSSASPTIDIALLKVDAMKLPYLAFSDMRSARVGMEVFTMGYPSTNVLGTEAKFSSGVINSLSGLQGETSLMQISVPLQPGNSGGPLVNNRGEVVGIVTSTAAVGEFLAATGTLPQNINWAVKSDFVLPMFDWPETLAPTSTRDKAIERTAAALCYVEALR